jgi:hypothetical protein
MDTQLKSIIENCANNYKRMLKSFRPCRPGGEFLEQNIITLVAHEFLQAFPDGFAFSEIPFVKDTKNINKSSGWPCRLDLFLYNSEIGYAIEVKGSKRRGEFFSAIEKDVERLISEELISSLESMATARGSELPKTIKGVILADCWYKDESDKWEFKNDLGEGLYIEKLDTMRVVIGEFGNYEYSLLAGEIQEPIKYGL